MTEKKIHWKTAQKLAKESGTPEVSEEVIETQEPLVEELIVETKQPKAEPAQKGKTEWTVVYDDRGVHKEFTYKLSDTEDAYERALKVALKKGGKVI